MSIDRDKQSWQGRVYRWLMRSRRKADGIEAAKQRWHDTGPLSEQSLRLLVDWRELALLGQPTELVFAAFVRTLTPEQKRALDEIIKLVGSENASNLF